jgi:predicted AlkP superfamily pyrophosphatase or phosphodiesterase
LWSLYGDGENCSTELSDQEIMLLRSEQILRMFRFTAIIFIVTLPMTTAASDDSRPPGDVRLVLQITIDGMRNDLLYRYGQRFSPGGFRYLLDSGTVFTNAHYQHANTETIVGHTTLATGAFPADHGMIGNVWYDRDSDELAYNIEDPAYPPLPSRSKRQIGEQVDPAQRLARTQGRSPASILAETLGDRLKAYYGGRSKVFAVSGKDRGAVSMAGHVGKAFWLSTDSGDFITSRYYYDAYPAWVGEWNAERRAESFGDRQWELLNELDTYLLGHQDDREYETDLRGYGRVFPHRYAAAGSPILPTQVIVSPAGDRLTLSFAKALVHAEGLGDDSIPDYLGISFSGLDAVNHFFGPSSLENEDMVLQLDRTLEDLFTFIDQTIGLDKTLIAFSADHGMAEMPEYMTELGFRAGRLYPEDIITAANHAGKVLFDIEDIVKFYYRPYLYLESAKIEAAGLDTDNVQREIAAALTGQAGVALAVARNEIQAPQITPLLQQIQRNFHPDRSGDIYVVQNPYWFNFDKGPVAAMHGSPWRYDTHVPIIFAGVGIRSHIVHRLVHPVDVAPTLSALLGMTAPGSSRGTILTEVLSIADDQ